ncbi:glycosyltransferase family 2 protein [Bisgaard Taxon 10/6]|uniref:glycosyltransferase family 2 protein n=1 Tax=Exercitatus varius TaxID=67857 RepID=UPI00294B6921|nr:glycosyltransferase family 2 protein [Exercitatus varius]MDG2947545.1 glycosyltransferase family 2 protein [Exercitatus varius]
MSFLYDIILCTYNGAPFISKQLESFLIQDIKPNKIIISDDGSSDYTLAIINKFFNQKNFTNYEIISGPKKGVINNFFFALKYAKSDYIFLSDQDDIWHKEKISEFSKIAHHTDKPNLIFSDAILIDEIANEIDPSFFQYQGLTVKCLDDDSILFKNCVQGAACAINKPLRDLVLQSLKVIDVNNLYMHDWWIALLAKYYGGYQFIDKPLIYYRQHSQNQVGASSNKYRFLSYFLQFTKYWNNFRKAISQINELERVTLLQNGSSLKYKKNRQYKYIPKIKLLAVKLLNL